MSGRSLLMNFDKLMIHVGKNVKFSSLIDVSKAWLKELVNISGYNLVATIVREKPTAGGVDIYL